jgi:origin recognition complex subunit 5
VEPVNRDADKAVRWNDTFDGFVRGLRAVHAYLGKGKEKQGDERPVIVVERADTRVDGGTNTTCRTGEPFRRRRLWRN